MSTAVNASSSSASVSPRSAFRHPSPRASFASRPSPRRAFNAPTAASSSPQQPKQIFPETGPLAGSIVGYVDAGTQYSPDGLPPTAGPKVAAITGRPPGSSMTGGGGSSSSTNSNSGGARKRKESTTLEPSSEPMSESSASSGGPARSAQHHLEEPVPRHDPSSASSSDTPAEPELQEARSTHGHSAAPKRSRPEGTLKVMPPQYETCHPKDLGILIANMLMELIRINDRIPLRDGRLTRFHSRAPPGISVTDYLQRLIQHATLSPPILLSMVYYIDRLCTMYPAFTINSLTVHRFLITAATVAAKGLSDSFWTNPTYARIGGIPVSELAALELELLQRVQWKIVPKPEVLVDYYQSLVDRIDGFTIETSPSRGSTSVDNSSSDESETENEKELGGEDQRMRDANTGEKL